MSETVHCTGWLCRLGIERECRRRVDAETAKLRAQIAASVASQTALREALAKHAVTQWEDGWWQCHICGQLDRDGVVHAPDCQLAATPVTAAARQDGDGQ